MIKNKNETEQKVFFDKYIENNQYENLEDDGVFLKLSLLEIDFIFDKLKNAEKILDYGCGAGKLIKYFLEKNGPNYNFIGVDISKKSVDLCKRNLRGNFYLIENNCLEQLQDDSIDAAYICMVLHHAEDHAKIIQQITQKLRPGGLFAVVDLAPNNMFINFGRKIFCFLPEFIKSRFKDDLYVDGGIPDKINVFPNKIEEYISQSCDILSSKRSRLFIFLVEWFFRIIRIKLKKDALGLINKLNNLDYYLSNTFIFKKYAHTFTIVARKR